MQNNVLAMYVEMVSRKFQSAANFGPGPILSGKQRSVSRERGPEI